MIATHVTTQAALVGMCLRFGAYNFLLIVHGAALNTGIGCGCCIRCDGNNNSCSRRLFSDNNNVGLIGYRIQAGMSHCSCCPRTASSSSGWRWYTSLPRDAGAGHVPPSGEANRLCLKPLPLPATPVESVRPLLVNRIFQLLLSGSEFM